MPLYEYRCQACGRRFTALVGVVADARAPECPRCHGQDLQRLMSRFARVRAEDDVLDSLGDMPDIDENSDPREIGKWARKMAREMGEDGADLEEAFEEAMAEEAAGGGAENADDVGVSPGAPGL